MIAFYRWKKFFLCIFIFNCLLGEFGVSQGRENIFKIKGIRGAIRSKLNFGRKVINKLTNPIKQDSNDEDSNDHKEEIEKIVQPSSTFPSIPIQPRSEVATRLPDISTPSNIPAEVPLTLGPQIRVTPSPYSTTKPATNRPPSTNPPTAQIETPYPTSEKTNPPMPTIVTIPPAVTPKQSVQYTNAPTITHPPRPTTLSPTIPPTIIPRTKSKAPTTLKPNRPRRRSDQRPISDQVKEKKGTTLPKQRDSMEESENAELMRKNRVKKKNSRSFTLIIGLAVFCMCTVGIVVVIKAKQSKVGKETDSTRHCSYLSNEFSFFVDTPVSNHSVTPMLHDSPTFTTLEESPSNIDYL